MPCAPSSGLVSCNCTTSARLPALMAQLNAQSATRQALNARRIRTLGGGTLQVRSAQGQQLQCKCISPVNVAMGSCFSAATAFLPPALPVFTLLSSSLSQPSSVPVHGNSQEWCGYRVSSDCKEFATDGTLSSPHGFRPKMSHCACLNRSDGRVLTFKMQVAAHPP